MFILQTLAICTTILFVKVIVTLVIQGHSHYTPGPIDPEDFNLVPEKNAEEQHLIERELRWKRIVANDLENIPFGLIIFLLAFITQSNEIVNTVCVILFTVGRVGHTLAYAYSLQPYRSVFWAIGVLSVLAASINSIVGVFSA
ncbi:hypothetical protein BC833DRAFT_613713 [Globomyces pollinis-pini]|nr:hypothetical protein BC833DRAFT_613713 [Globomyces pollinis-pini]